MYYRSIINYICSIILVWNKVLINYLVQVMFDNRKEKNELLKALVVKDKDAAAPNYTQVFLPLILYNVPEHFEYQALVL